MNRSARPIVLVPGAWMGAWIWDGTGSRLRDRGHRVHALTLPGLEPDLAPTERAAVTLGDHVAAPVELIEALGGPALVVGHSYSGIVVGQAVDRLRGVDHRSVHIGSFLPRDGRSLLDDWGADPDARGRERAQVRESGLLWDPPPAAALEAESALTAQQRRYLGERFVPHPGRTVLDPVSMGRPVTEQPVTFVSTQGGDADPLDAIGAELRDQVGDWHLEALDGGHWPMLTRPVEIVDVIDRAAREP